MRNWKFEICPNRDDDVGCQIIVVSANTSDEAWKKIYEIDNDYCRVCLLDPDGDPPDDFNRDDAS